MLPTADEKEDASVIEMLGTPLKSNLKELQMEISLQRMNHLSGKGGEKSMQPLLSRGIRWH